MVNGNSEGKGQRKIPKLINKNKWVKKGEDEEMNETKTKKRNRASNSKGGGEDNVKVESRIKNRISFIYTIYTRQCIKKGITMLRK